MADNKPYPVALPAEAASQGIAAGYNAYKTPGILYGDGQGGIRTAQPGTDYGYPLLQGNGPPGGSTVAGLGQHYFDMAAAKPPYEYICVGYTAFGFVWTVYGDPGAGFQVLGRFSSLEALEAAVGEGLVPKPSAGDAYFIGDVAPYDMYFWDIMTQSWAYYGPLGGAGGSTDVTGIPPHGSEGQILSKLSDADYDVGWVDLPEDVIDTDRIEDEAVTGSKIAPGAVGATQLNDTAKGLAFTVTLSAAAWSDKKQTVSNVNFFASGYTYTVAPASASFAAYGKDAIFADDVTTDGEMTFNCTKVPDADLTVNIARAVSV